MEDLVEITGKPVYIVYRNEETFYTVMKFQMMEDSERIITATGILPSIEQDVLYHLYGKYIEHPRYGMQFAIVSYEKPLPNEEEGIIRYLSGVQFPGIGKKTAGRIVSALGDGCLEEIRRDPAVLRQIPGLSEHVIETIEYGIKQEDDGMQELVRFLNVHGIGMRNLIRLNRAYGKDALVKLKENPYRVIDECDGFGFATADKIAMNLGFAENDDRRLYALLVSMCMDRCMSTGDSWVDAETLRQMFLERIAPMDCDYDALMEQARMNRRLVQEANRVFPISQYESEDSISSFLARFPFQELEPPERSILDGYLHSLQEELQITYDEDQVSAIESFFQNPFLILTGGPGTGKTTVVRAMVQLFRLIYPGSTVLCAAPTGRAAKRLAELTDTSTYTIHSLLKWDLETNTFGMGKEEPLQADLLIVDEFSMVDNWLFYHLLLASEPIRKICIIGDEDQLPSVSPGCVLRDIIDADRFPLIRLTHIYRQKQGSDVIELAHMIHDGTVDFSSLKNEVRFFPCARQEIRDQILRIVQNALDKGYTMNDVQVLSPMYSGVAGIDVLNNALQECFNPPARGKAEIKSGYTVFRVGDKILQLKNQPDDDVYNGDIGILEEIDEDRTTAAHRVTLVVNFDGVYVEYTRDSLINITLAYCISIHKSQGSEYPIVIMPITYQQSIMLQRRLLYTGVTRAKKSLILLGEPGAFAKGVETLERHPRQTTLCRRLQERIPERDITEQ